MSNDAIVSYTHYRPEIIDETYIINMDKETNRLQTFDAMMTSEYDPNISWKYIRMPAINGKDVRNNITKTYRTDETELNLTNHLTTLSSPDPQLLKEKYIKLANRMSPGELGCLLSHVFLWERIATDPSLNRIAIFEDDARTHTDIITVNKLIFDLYEHLRINGMPEPDMLYLGKALDSCMTYERVWKNVYKSYHPLCLHAYIITKTGAQKLLQYAPYDEVADIVPIKLISKRILQVMSFHPSIYFQDVINNVSSLRQLGTALNITTECLVSQQHIDGNDLKFVGGVIVAFVAALILYIVFMWNLFPESMP